MIHSMVFESHVLISNVSSLYKNIRYNDFSAVVSLSRKFYIEQACLQQILSMSGYWVTCYS